MLLPGDLLVPPLCSIQQQLKPGVHHQVPAAFDSSAGTVRAAEGGRFIPFLQGGFTRLCCGAVSHLPAKYSPPAWGLESQRSGCAALIDRSQALGLPWVNLWQVQSLRISVRAEKGNKLRHKSCVSSLALEVGRDGGSVTVPGRLIPLGTPTVIPAGSASRADQIQAPQTLLGGVSLSPDPTALGLSFSLHTRV